MKMKYHDPIKNWDESIVKSSWIHYFFEMADVCRSKSKDPNTQVSAIITSTDNEIISMGYNGFPSGFSGDHNCSLWEKPNKYDYVVHAEQNALSFCAKMGHKSVGARIYITPLDPCFNCTKSIIQSGISDVFVKLKESSLNRNDYKDNHEKIVKLLNECKINYFMFLERGETLEFIETKQVEYGIGSSNL